MMRFGENMELYNEYELISHSKLADCSMFIVDMVYRPMHLHKEMELCYILSGTCRVSTDRQSFTAGETQSKEDSRTAQHILTPDECRALLDAYGIEPNQIFRIFSSSPLA